MKRAKGFTLVEIMIVVAIIGILIAIAVPGFIKARNVSRQNACQENQTKVDGAIQQAILDNNLTDASQVATFTDWGNDDAATNVAPGTTLADTGQATQADIQAFYGGLVAPDSYLKVGPRCPANGEYRFLWTTPGDAGNHFACAIDETLNPQNPHVFPGLPDDTAAPAAN